MDNCSQLEWTLCWNEMLQFYWFCGHRITFSTTLHYLFIYLFAFSVTQQNGWEFCKEQRDEDWFVVQGWQYNKNWACILNTVFSCHLYTEYEFQHHNPALLFFFLFREAKVYGLLLEMGWYFGYLNQQNLAYIFIQQVYSSLIIPSV